MNPRANWSYLRRYPQGAHVADAQRRLARLAAAFDPPSAFVPLDYDVPPPPDEVVYLSQPVVVFDGPHRRPDAEQHAAAPPDLRYFKQTK
jgi:hypothetical protein